MIVVLRTESTGSLMKFRGHIVINVFYKDWRICCYNQECVLSKFKFLLKGLWGLLLRMRFRLALVLVKCFLSVNLRFLLFGFLAFLAFFGAISLWLLGGCARFSSSDGCRSGFCFGFYSSGGC